MQPGRSCSPSVTTLSLGRFVLASKIFPGSPETVRDWWPGQTGRKSPIPEDSMGPLHPFRLLATQHLEMLAEAPKLLGL